MVVMRMGMMMVGRMTTATFVEHQQMDVMVQNRALMLGNPEFESCSTYT